MSDQTAHDIVRKPTGDVLEAALEAYGRKMTADIEANGVAYLKDAMAAALAAAAAAGGRTPDDLLAALDLSESRVERYRNAWLSARRRATAHDARAKLDRATDLFEKWAAEENEHRVFGELGIAEGLHVAIDDLREAVHGEGDR